MAEPKEPDSPKIRKLARSLRTQGRAAEARFWSSITRTKLPLVEPVDDDPASSWVTYVWRGDAKTRSVGISSPQTEFGDLDPLSRLKGSHVWHRTVKTKNDCMGAYLFVPNPPSMKFDTLTDFLGVLARGKLDPFNPSRFISTADPVVKDKTIYGGEYSVLRLKGAPNHEEVNPHAGRPCGTIRQHQLRSRVLKNRRRVWVYTPPMLGGSTRTSRLVIFFDGFGYLNEIAAPTTLDNLITTHKIPPTYAVFVDALDLATRSRELRPNPDFGIFLSRELFPWIRRTVGRAFDGSESALAGFSLGGLCSAYWAMRYPTRFRRVLSQSGSFWWAPKEAPEPNGMAREFMRRRKLPLRIYMDAGRYEGSAAKENGEGQLASNRHLRDVLLLKGYQVRYQTYNGGHDTYCWRQTLVEALPWVLA